MGKTTCYYWNKCTMLFVRKVEKCFYNLGVSIANHPWRTIGLCWLFVIVSSLGMLNFYQEKDPMKLWVPPDSDFSKDTDWLINTFKIGYRPQYVLATAPNVLEPDVLAELARISNKINNMKAHVNNMEYTWNDICFKVPIVQTPEYSRKKRRVSSNSSIFFDDIFSMFDKDIPADNGAPNIVSKAFDPSVDIATELYCNIIESFQMGCLQTSLLDLWKFNDTDILKLQLNDVIETINTTNISPTLGHHMEYTSSLGGIERDQDGKIISAKSILLTWFVHINFTSTDMDITGNQAGTESWVSKAALAWEEQFLKVLDANFLIVNVSNLKVFYEAGRSYGDISGTTMFQDIDKLVFGIIMMIIYIQIIMSKFNWVEMRLIIGSIGLLCIAMALIVASGLCSLFGIPYGPVHTSLPFLIMGLGIDDMFVMKACWDQLTEPERLLPLSNQIGLMLQHAGVSIVITSFTDVVAFLVGSFTILPSLQSFCFYAAAAVTFVFVFSVTFYVAIFALDIRRMSAKRNGALFCITHPNFTPSDKNQKSVSQYALNIFYSKFIFKTPVKILVVLITLAITGFSLEALMRLEQRFDPIWFIPDNTYYKKYLNEREVFYPDIGNEGMVFIGAINYTQELPKLYQLIDNLQSEKDAVHNIDTWTTPFRDYVLLNFEKDVKNYQLSEEQWSSYLSKFLHSPSGAVHQSKFRFDGDLKCGQLAPPIQVSSLVFQFKRFPGPKIYLPAMHKVKDIVREANFTTGDHLAIVWAKIFANWVTDEVIALEVERNLELALVCVMACTVVLITNVQMCVWILVCVLLTMVNVCGMMQRWGLTVDVVSCVGLELAVGLCVDYAAHVGHTFLTVQGSRQERAFHTVTSIGAAVLYGGGSTLLAVSVLCTSDSYIFLSFFKIFLLVIGFGLFHGIIFLPVVLSVIGPKGYSDDENAIKSADQEKDAVDIREMDNLKVNDRS